ncbi:protein TEX261-like [Zophobas morio]|uniref:protein TEX261-like n=1 Tax=Zophobas morio TaxID=2755281 RepID=UPI003083C5FE
MFLSVLYAFYTVYLTGALLIAVGCTLLYLAEFSEEYPETTKRFIEILILVSVINNVGLWVLEGFPLLNLVVSSFSANIAYFLLIRNFPFIRFRSFSFLLSIGTTLWHQYSAWKYFSINRHYTNSEVFAYFVVCSLAVPFALVISLQTFDNRLPTSKFHTFDALNAEDYPSKNKSSFFLMRFIKKRRDEILPLRGFKAN